MIRIKYEQLFPTGVYTNCRIGLEMDTEEHAIDHGLMTLKLIVNEFHQKEFPQFYKDNKPIYSGEEEVIQETKPIKGFQGYVDAMNECITIEELKTHHTIASMNPKLMKVYNEKLNSFQS